MAPTKIESEYDWQFHPDIEKRIENIIQEAQTANPDLAHFHNRLRSSTSSHLIQWIEAIYLPQEEASIWKNSGFQTFSHHSGYETCHHPGGQFPYVVFVDKSLSPQKKIALSVEDVPLFLMVNGIHSHIEGSPMSRKRSSLISHHGGWGFEVHERRGEFHPIPEYLSQEEIVKRLSLKDRFRMRHRVALQLQEEEILLKSGCHIVEEAVSACGKAFSASVFLEVEREFWQSKNRAGQIQFARQNSVGLGWANHDHHTFRSSRRFFQQTIHLFELLGFQCRERFWAGKEAGWGAQVLEHPEARGVLFIDVDLTENEVGNDFSHMPLPEIAHVGTIGLWCALHGESILNAGMHHLEAQFDFHRLESDLQEIGVGMMKPFSSFSYLKQAFTAGERWKVRSERVQYLIDKGLISPATGSKFLQEGAVGSHLENLERHEGYKGFNKNNVSVIIKETDPRNQK